VLAGPPIDHVALAVRDTASALRLYVDILGLQAGPTVTAPGEGLRVTFLSGPAGRLEILEPLDADSPVGRFLERRGEGLHHLCFRVPDLGAALARLAAAGYQIVDERPRRGLDGRPAAFVHPRSAGGVLIELYQDDPGPRAGEGDDE